MGGDCPNWGFLPGVGVRAPSSERAPELQNSSRVEQFWITGTDQTKPNLWLLLISRSSAHLGALNTSRTATALSHMSVPVSRVPRPCVSVRGTFFLSISARLPLAPKNTWQSTLENGTRSICDCSFHLLEKLLPSGRNPASRLRTDSPTFGFTAD